MKAENVLRAAKLLGVYTAGRYDIWLLAGRTKVTCRQHIMTVMMLGETAKKNVPQKDCGVTMMETKFYHFVKPAGSCRAAKEDYFKAWCASVGQGLTDEMYLDYVNNHLTVEHWAEHHNIDDVDKAKAMINGYKSIRDHYHLGQEWEG